MIRTCVAADFVDFAAIRGSAVAESDTGSFCTAAIFFFFIIKLNKYDLVFVPPLFSIKGSSGEIPSFVVFTAGTGIGIFPMRALRMEPRLNSTRSFFTSRFVLVRGSEKFLAFRIHMTEYCAVSFFVVTFPSYPCGKLLLFLLFGVCIPLCCRSTLLLLAIFSLDFFSLYNDLNCCYVEEIEGIPACSVSMINVFTILALLLETEAINLLH